jgi:hypothetical protein
MVGIICFGFNLCVNANTPYKVKAINYDVSKPQCSLHLDNNCFNDYIYLKVGN